MGWTGKEWRFQFQTLVGPDRDLAPCQTAPELHKFLWRESEDKHSFETMRGVCEDLFVFLVNMLDL